MNLAPLRRSFFFEFVVFAYCATIIYATLFPWVGWRVPSGSPFRFLGEPWPRFWTRFDVVSNFVAYLPLGALLALRLRATLRGILIVLAAVTAAAALSFTLESLQSYLPTRVPSRLDLLVNSAGGGCGALLAILFLPRPEQRRQIQWHRPASLHPESSIVIVLAGLWLLAQLSPQRMLFETGSWLSPVVSMLQRNALSVGVGGSGEFAMTLLTIISAIQVSSVYTTLIEGALVAASIAALGLLLTDALATTPARLVVISMLLAVAVLFRGLATGWATGSVEFGYWLSGGAQLGLLLGPILLIVLSSARRRRRLLWTLTLLIAGLVLANLVSDNGLPRQIVGAAGRHDSLRSAMFLFQAIAIAWPFAAIAVVVRQLYLHNRRWEGLPFIRESALSQANPR